MSEMLRAVLACVRERPAPDGEGWHEVRFVFGEDYPGFAGHFPGDPVLPGVVQMMAGCVAAGEWLGKVPSLRAVKNAKFLAPVRPGEYVAVRARPNGQDAAEVRVLKGLDPAASFTLLFQDKA